MFTRLLLLFTLFAALAQAHGIDDGFLQLTQTETHWNGIWKGPVALFAGCDDNKDGEYSREELARHWPQLHQDKVRVSDAEGRSYLPVLDAGQPIQSPAQLSVPVRFECPPSSSLTVDYQLYLAGVQNQQCRVILTSSTGEMLTRLLNPAKPRETINWTPQVHRPSGFVGFFQLGVEHILTGWDHLLFLLTLVIAGGSLWRWLQVITAFSLAHSLSLALAVFGVVHLDSAIVEPIIALSITVAAVMALRGLQAQTMHGGWQMAFGFGLIHGLGFAGVLAELQLSGRAALMPLISFNLGVEAGQLAVAAALLPLIRALCRDEGGTRLRQAITAAAGCMGLYWFITRVGSG